MLSETHITDFSDKELKIDGFLIERCDSNSRHTGGVAIYIKNSINYKVIHNKHKSKTWILAIQISDSLINGRFVVIYKSPKEKINDFLAILDEFCEEWINDEHKILIVGDINIDVSKVKILKNI